MMNVASDWELLFIADLATDRSIGKRSLHSCVCMLPLDDTGRIGGGPYPSCGRPYR
jgi:hypothetical protein